MNAVLFDADGVLQLAPDFLHLRLAEAIGRAADERETCMAEVFAAEAPALTGAATFEAGLQVALAKLEAKCDVDTVIRHWCEIEPDGAILAMIGRLRAKGVYCAIASNQERNRARHMSERLGYGRAFHQEFYSCDVGHAKPSPSYFEAVIRTAALAPHRTLFIDDRLENVEAARGCGLLAEQFVLWRSGATELKQILRKHGLAADS
ncbi:MAG TPA: HAD-IA family hydrolase [Caulobacteraceae bacterium]|nr:HAD-IA family hydrolase [Caulobacteraceae bacterium]